MQAVVAMTVKEFLLARLSEETDVDNTAIRAEIERHNDRSMWILGGASAPEVRTRCGLCVHEYTRPCLALRRIASKYQNHPDFDQAWTLPTAART